MHVNCLCFNPLNTELNPICHLLALLGARHILHVSRIRVNVNTFGIPMCAQLTLTYNLWEGTEDDLITVETCSPIVVSENKCCADVKKIDLFIWHSTSWGLYTNNCVWIRSPLTTRSDWILNYEAFLTEWNAFCRDYVSPSVWYFFVTSYREWTSYRDFTKFR